MARKFKRHELDEAPMLTPEKRGLALKLIDDLMLPAPIEQAIDFQMLIASVLVLNDGPATWRGAPWTDSESAILYWGYREFSGHFVASVLGFSRSLRSIQVQAQCLGFSAGHHWTAKEIQLLLEQYEVHGPANCLRIVVPGRSEKAVCCKLYKLGKKIEGNFSRSARSSTGNPRQYAHQRAESGGTTRRWTPEDVARLQYLYPRSTSVRAVARALDRSYGSVANKASALGLTMELET